jgi:hypothetical protein
MTVARIAFVRKNLRDASLALIYQCNAIIKDYQGQGLRLTLRQLYYQLVTRNAITNEEKSYKNLSSVVTDARLTGRMDWNAIEDRVRVPRTPSEWDSITDLVDSAVRAFRLPRWHGQTHYAELWVEKDALAGVLEPLAREHHVTLMVNRGYSSASAMFEAAARFVERCRRAEGDEDLDEVDTAYEDGNWDTDGMPVELVRKPILFYLGDHDPSGEDMVRDVRDRLHTFGIDVEVQKIALTTAQVKQYNPPPNPAKMSDPRALDYVRKHGRVSWEVDALPPQVLSTIVRQAFAMVLDRKKYEAVIAREEKGKEALRVAARKIEV